MLNDTLYAKYIEERAGGKIIEDDRGFIAYRINGPECFIMEMYIAEDYRKGGAGREFIDKLSSIAKEHGCTHITGNVFLDLKGASNTLIAALMVGFRVAEGSKDAVLIVKEIGG